MKTLSLREFMEANPSYAIKRTGIDSKALDNRATVDMINNALDRETAEPFLTPYMALGVVSKILAYAAIVVPQTQFLSNDSDVVIFDATHFGKIDGYATEEEDQPDYYVYFEYILNDVGTYTVFAQLVDLEDLEELTGEDLDGDDEEGESEEHKEAVLGVTEETIEEISKEKLEKYKDAATDDMHKKAFQAGNAISKMDFHTSPDLVKKALKRSVGIEKAKKKLKEEENITEVSDKKLHDYIDGAYSNKAKHLNAQKHANEIGQGMKARHSWFKAVKRAQGIELAKTKLKGDGNLGRVCPKCFEKGCPRCHYTGRLYEENINEVWSKDDHLGKLKALGFQHNPLSSDSVMTHEVKDPSKSQYRSAREHFESHGFEHEKDYQGKKVVYRHGDNSHHINLENEHDLVQIGHDRGTTSVDYLPGMGKKKKLKEENITEISDKKLHQYMNANDLDFERHNLLGSDAFKKGDTKKVAFHLRKLMKRKHFQDVANSKLKGPGNIRMPDCQECHGDGCKHCHYVGKIVEDNGSVSVKHK